MLIRLEVKGASAEEVAKIIKQDPMGSLDEKILLRIGDFQTQATVEGYAHSGEDRRLLVMADTELDERESIIGGLQTELKLLASVTEDLLRCGPATDRYREAAALAGKMIDGIKRPPKVGHGG